MSQPELRRRAKHEQRQSTRRRIVAVERVTAAFALLGPGRSERRPRIWIAAVLGGAALTALALLRLFVPSAVGMADAGDGFRLLCSAGLANERPFTADAAGAVFPIWSPADWSGAACPEPPLWPFSPFHLLVALARLLGGGVLDVRLLGVLLAVVLGLLTVALIRYLPGAVPFRLVVAALFGVVLLDGVFADFLVSADLDGTVLLAVLAGVVALLILWGGWADRVTTLDVPPRGIAATVLGVLLGAAALATSPALLAFLPGFVAGLVLLPWMRDAEERRSRESGRALRGDRGRELARTLASRVPSLLAALALVAVAVAQAGTSLERVRADAVYATIFGTILPSSPDPAADVEWFGLPERALEASGRWITDVQAGAVLADPAFAEIGVDDLIRFQVTHPERIVAVADRGLAAISQPVQQQRGSTMLPLGDGEPVQDQRWTPVATSSPLLFAVPLIVPGLQFAGILVALSLAFARQHPVRSRSLGFATVFAMLAGWIHFWAVALGDQRVLSEAMLPSTLLFWLGLPLLFACAAVRLAGPGEKSSIRAPEAKNALIAAITRPDARPSP